MTLHVSRTVLLVSAVLAASCASGFAQSLDAGRKAYETRCAGCHGSDGTGGSQGPDIVARRQPRAASTAAMRDLLRSGIPGTGMPAFPLPDVELDAIVSYIGVLKAPAADNPTAGDAVAGERFFTGKGNCSSCHMVRGRGGILGPDLSNLGRERKTLQIEQAIREPGVRRTATREDDAQSFKAVSLRMRDGRTLRGLAKYESPFDLGVQSLDGRFHSISTTSGRSDHLGAVADAEGRGIGRGDARPPRLPDAARRGSIAASDASRDRRGRRQRGDAVRRHRSTEARRVADLSWAAERQPPQPARPDQPCERGTPRADVDFPGAWGQRCASRSRRSSSTV